MVTTDKKEIIYQRMLIYALVMTVLDICIAVYGWTGRIIESTKSITLQHAFNYLPGEYDLNRYLC